MTRPRPGIGIELFSLGLIFVCLTGTWFLIQSMYRRASAARKATATVRPEPVVILPPPIRVDPPVPPPPLTPPEEDPTRKALVQLGAAEAEQILNARAADRKAESLEKARQTAVAESQRWWRREVLVRAQLDDLADRARHLEDEADKLAQERDALARERDMAKAALTKARTRSSYAILPNKAPNGTWRRPIVFECRNGTVTLQPQGPTFTLLDLSAGMGLRSNPLIASVAHELLKIEGAAAPDGSPIVPYIFFVVRPDGIRPYYEARGRLEPLGIAFGYELVEQDTAIDYPDLDNVEEWDGSPPLHSTPTIAGTFDVPETGPSRSRARSGDPNDSFVWPMRPPGSPGGEGGGSFSPSERRRSDGGSGGDPLGDLYPAHGGHRGSTSTSDVLPPSVATERGLGERPGLIPIKPEGLPGLEDPTAAGSSGAGSEAGGPQREGEGHEGGGLAMPAPEAGRVGEGAGSDGSGRGEPGASSAGNEGRPIGDSSGTPGSGAGDAGSVGGGRGGRAEPLLQPRRIDVPMDIVVACERDGVVIHPGGYRLSSAILRGKGDMLARELQSIVRLRQQVDPLIRPRPRVKFLVEAEGSETYWDARRQYVLSGLVWPVSLQVSDANVPSVFPKERW